MCVGSMCEGASGADSAYRQGYHLRLYARLSDCGPGVRAAAAVAVGCLLRGGRDRDRDLVSARALVGACDDASPGVRFESTVAIGSCVGKHLDAFAAVSSGMPSAMGHR